jgi:hypothetical protein
MTQLALGCRLIDSQARHQADPERWDYPWARIRIIEPGDMVKVCASLEERFLEEFWAGAKAYGIENPPSGERFWCRVERVMPDGLEVRVVQSDMMLSELHGVRNGDILLIERRHILDVEDGAAQPAPEKGDRR